MTVGNDIDDGGDVLDNNDNEDNDNDNNYNDDDGKMACNKQSRDRG